MIFFPTLRYVADRHYPSYEYRGELRVGAVLPDGGVTYYEVPPEYARAQEYRYTIINGHTVLVDPRTHTVIQIVDLSHPFGKAALRGGLIA
jgi:hypothetical protein